MNNINTEQNKEEILLLLFSQKTLYNNARTAKYFVIFLSIFNFMLGIVLKTTLVYKEQLSIFICIIALISIYLKNNSSKSNDFAASTQELIDRKLYGFKTEDRFLENHSSSSLKSIAMDLKDKYPKKYLININNSGTDTPNGVKDWYTKIYPSLSKEEAILKCQRQNIYWDKYLIEYYKKLLNALCFIILIMFLIFYWNQGVNSLVLGIISSFSVFDILRTELSMANKFIIYNIVIDSIISTSQNLSTINFDLLEDLQSKIFSRRKSGFNLPSFIHKLKIIKVHSNYNRDN